MSESTPIPLPIRIQEMASHITQEPQAAVESRGMLQRVLPVIEEVYEPEDVVPLAADASRTLQAALNTFYQERVDAPPAPEPVPVTAAPQPPAEPAAQGPVRGFDRQAVLDTIEQHRGNIPLLPAEVESIVEVARSEYDERHPQGVWDKAKGVVVKEATKLKELVKREHPEVPKMVDPDDPAREPAWFDQIPSVVPTGALRTAPSISARTQSRSRYAPLSDNDNTRLARARKAIERFKRTATPIGAFRKQNNLEYQQEQSGNTDLRSDQFNGVPEVIEQIAGTVTQKEQDFIDGEYSSLNTQTLDALSVLMHDWTYFRWTEIEDQFDIDLTQLVEIDYDGYLNEYEHFSDEEKLRLQKTIANAILTQQFISTLDKKELIDKVDTEVSDIVGQNGGDWDTTNVSDTLDEVTKIISGYRGLGTLSTQEDYFYYRIGRQFDRIYTRSTDKYSLSHIKNQASILSPLTSDAELARRRMVMQKIYDDLSYRDKQEFNTRFPNGIASLERAFLLNELYESVENEVAWDLNDRLNQNLSPLPTPQTPATDGWIKRTQQFVSGGVDTERQRAANFLSGVTGKLRRNSGGAPASNPGTLDRGWQLDNNPRTNTLPPPLPISAQGPTTAGSTTPADPSAP